MREWPRECKICGEVVANAEEAKAHFKEHADAGIDKIMQGVAEMLGDTE
jgi:hypothetical protein